MSSQSESLIQIELLVAHFCSGTRQDLTRYRVEIGLSPGVQVVDQSKLPGVCIPVPISSLTCSQRRRVSKLITTLLGTVSGSPNLRLLR